MRVIAGSRKGARIAAPKGARTRPTGDRVREAVFSIIGPVEGATVLDLFAGSGAMGIEALSRGAGRAVFVESDRGAVRVLKANLEKVGLTGAVVHERDAFRVLRDEGAAGRTYDLVLVDPPYGEYTRVEMRLSDLLPGVLAAGALVVVETDERTTPSLPLEQVTTRRYGSTRITVYASRRGHA